MRAIITDIKHFAVHDGDGIRTTVFFKGCPLRCRWCHNPETFYQAPQLGYFAHRCTACGRCAAVCTCHRVEQGAHQFDRAGCTTCGRCVEECPAEALRIWGREMTVEEVFDDLVSDRMFYETSGGGVTLSGGECLLYPDFCAALLRRCREAGIHTAVDTCGHVPQTHLDAVIPDTDVFLYDLKAADGAVHRRLTGCDNVLILENLRYLDARGCRIEIRVPYVPGQNDGEMAAIAEIVRGLCHVTSTRVLPYHDLAGSKYAALGMAYPMAGEPIPTEEELEQARSMFVFSANRKNTDGVGVK